MTHYPLIRSADETILGPTIDTSEAQRTRSMNRPPVVQNDMLISTSRLPPYQHLRACTDVFDLGPFCEGKDTTAFTSS